MTRAQRHYLAHTIGLATALLLVVGAVVVGSRIAATIGGLLFGWSAVSRYYALARIDLERTEKP